MDCLGVEVQIPDTKRAKREKKLSISMSNKILDRKQTVDLVKKVAAENGGRDCTKSGFLLESQLPDNALSPQPVSSPPKRSLQLKAPSPIKQPAGQRRRKPQDKKVLIENGSIHGVSEPSKQAACENFFLPASKKRKLPKSIPVEENDIVVTNQGIKRRIEEVPSAGSISVTDVATEIFPNRDEACGLFQQPLEGKRVSSKLLCTSTQISEIGLRAKAALDAKENALRSAGKPIHPIFLKAKASTTKVAISSSDAGVLEPCPPIHVTQWLEDERTQTNWEDSASPPTSPIQRCKEEELIISLVQSGYKLQDHLLISKPRSLNQDNASRLQKDLGTSTLHTTSGVSYVNTCPILSREQCLQDLQEYLQHSSKPERKFAGACVKPFSCDITSSNSVDILKDRLSWYDARHNSLHSDKDKGAFGSQKNMLWTDLYQPKASKEVCGNFTGVELLNTWLHSWREKMTGQVNCPDLSQKKGSTRNHDLDDDRGWFEDESETETDPDEESGLCSTLLVTGPTGCGKSAAIYACAAEQGLTVIEVNGSCCRSGASILQKFGRGGLESQAMGKWSSVEDQTSPLNESSGKEANNSQKMSNHVGKASPQGPRKGKREGKTRGKAAGKNVRHPVGTSSIGRKLFENCIPNGMEENLGMGIEEPETGSAQKKKMTVILFEDVDVQFEEDRGFLTALVQLAKKTKRPMIFTSTSRQPGLPQILEKTRIDFFYPAPEELTVHASMVCIAEGVACSPWMVDRLVGSCHNDIRKVMMALQFWKQDDCPSPKSSLQRNMSSESSFDNFEDPRVRSVGEGREGTRRNLSLSRPFSSGILNLNEKVAPVLSETNAFRQWDADARYLFELDIHHIVLPDLFTSNFPCLLSLEVAGKINSAVSELEKLETMAAVKDAEEQGLVIQAKLDAAEAERKALRRAKDALRRASRMKAEVVDGEGPVLAKAESDENKFRLSESPVKNIREARALARTCSPLKLKPKRALLLYNSDNDEEGPEAQVQDDSCLSCISNLFSGGTPVTELHGNQAAPANVGISDDLEDKDVVLDPSFESVSPVIRKRILQDLEDGVSRSTMLRTEINLNIEIDSEEVNVVTGSCPDEVERLSPLCQISSTATISETASRENIGLDRRHSVTGSTRRDVDLVLDVDHVGNPIVGVLTKIVDASQPEVLVEKTKPTAENIVFDVDLNLVPCVVDNEVVEYEAVNNDVNINYSDGGQKRHAGNAVTGSDVDPKAIGAYREDRSRSCDVENVMPVAKSRGFDVERSVSLFIESGIKLSDQLEAGEEVRCRYINPVEEAWRTMRDDRQALRDRLGPIQPNINITDALATVLDVISASQTISIVSSESWKNARTNFKDTLNGLVEGNIGHCCLWECGQEIASQFVRAGLQKLSTSLLVSPPREARIPVVLGILSAAKDVPAVGKCMVTCNDMKSMYNSANLLKVIDSTYSKEETARHLKRQERLEEIITTRLLPRGRMTGSSRLEYSAYLARMSQSEEQRRTQTFSESRRSRRFQHHLNPRMSDADIAEISLLCKFGKA
ncbi:ATPase family AAA domain-containing protein 5 [Marchantia polymorpha subsp. ruderalis]|uniref:AAA+ ATPase domain-containing protein n=4 Tax=Marchantia polymorpha TaxID=3197 RepID=A0AAF6AW58_MARPO|nr:hypothetical protein MARPO_0007s0100 [Marchantia polymorpha]BBN03992.1 hypothetical protein Mp_3g01040 [Marchantia polymorpha subsp. ruderalis]|eukprot:PTQ47682.1 hypothetical protein MARPO_0007s0100 [Marchantia polymorpha]